MTKYCEDCRWCEMPPDRNAGYAKCNSPLNIKPKPSALALVSRKPPAADAMYIYCETQRDCSQGCGADGKWYEARLEVVA